MARRIQYSAASIVTVLLFLFLSAGPAFANEPVLVDRQVETVSSAQVARDLVSKITDVELGSSGATVTMDIDGEERSMNISLGGANGKGVGGFFGMATLSGVAAAAVRFAGKIIRMRF